MFLFTAGIIFMSSLSLLKCEISPGACPDTPPNQNFTLDQFTGKWYVVEAASLDSTLARCNTIDFSQIYNGTGQVLLDYYRLYWPVYPVHSPGIGMNNGNGKMFFDIVQPIFGVKKTHYNVLKTDYFTYAITWTCEELGMIHKQEGWILSRKRVLDDGEKKQIHEIVAQNENWKFKQADYKTVNQRDCGSQ